MNQNQTIEGATRPKLFLAVRIRGTVGDNPRMELALKSLGMESKFNARLVPGNPDMLGMLRKAKDQVTWGELEPETLEMILSKRAEKSGPGPHRLDEEFARLHFKIQDLGDLAKQIIGGEVDLQLSRRARPVDHPQRVAPERRDVVDRQQRVDSRRVPSDPTIVVVSLATGVEKSTVSPNE